MLEKFTPDEIAQLKLELRNYKPQSNKTNLCEQDIVRLERAFSEYRDRIGIFPSYDLKRDIWDICDWAVCNLRIDTKPGKFGRDKYKRSSYVRPEDTEVYRELFHRIVDAILEMKKPIKEHFPMLEE